MALFGGDEVDRRIKEVREEWKSVIEGSAVRCSECGSVFSTPSQLEEHIRSTHGGQLSAQEQQSDMLSQHWFEAVQMSPRRMGAYMLGGFILLILFAVFGVANLWLAPLTGIAGYFLVRKGRQGNPMAILLGILFLTHPAILLLTVIGLNFAALAAILGLLGFVLAGIEDSAKRELGPYGALLFHALSALFIPLWVLSLANVVLSILATDFLSLGFGAMVVASIGTSAYLFASGNIADGIGVYRGIGAGVLSLYERLVVGYELSSDQDAEVATITVGSGVVLLYGLVLVVDPSAFFGIPFFGGLLGQNPLVPFLFGMMGPLAFYHFLTRAEDIMRGGAAAMGRATGAAVAAGSSAVGRSGRGGVNPQFGEGENVHNVTVSGRVVKKNMDREAGERMLHIEGTDGWYYEVHVTERTYSAADIGGNTQVSTAYADADMAEGTIQRDGQQFRGPITAYEVA